MKSVSFIVLNWNGEDVISRCLDATSRALDNYEGPGEVIVVDNGSSDGSESLIERDYPRVRLVKLGENLGFSEWNNVGVRESRGDIVILVNNDAYVHPDFLIPILPHFYDDQIFSVTPKVYGLDGSTLTIGKTGAYFYRGIFRLKFTEDILSSPVPCLWATGGSGAFDRRKYLDLGGLLELLYWEDLEFELPPRDQHAPWLRVIDTSRPAPDDFSEHGQEQPVEGSSIVAKAHSVVVLISHKRS